MANPLALVIEDSPTIIEIFIGALEAASFTVEVCHDGQEALDRLAEVVPDVVVVDLHLPGLSGDEVIEEIAADRRLENTKIIIASADARMAEGLRDKADLVLIKPISFAQMRTLATRLNPQNR